MVVDRFESEHQHFFFDAFSYWKPPKLLEKGRDMRRFASSKHEACCHVLG
jgi:hypothetical protein